MNEWQPIETAPKDGTYVLIYDPPDPENYPNGGIYNAGGIYIACWKQEEFVVYHKTDPWNWCVFGTYQDEQGGEMTVWTPTYWMPLPEPPNIKRNL